MLYILSEPFQESMRVLLAILLVKRMDEGILHVLQMHSCVSEHEHSVCLLTLKITEH